MYEITMPKLSDSMEGGKIIAWKVKEGAKVSEGDILAEVESDKAAMELECFQSGVLKEIVHGDGDEVAVGEVIGRIAPGGEDGGGEETKKEEPKKKEKKAEATPAKKPAKKEKKEETEPEEAEETAPEKAPPEEAKSEKPERKEVRPEKAERTAAQGARVAISPYARKLAAERGIDLSELKGTGPDSRIVARDVESYQPGRKRTAEEEVGETKQPKESAREAGKPEKPESPKENVDPRAKSVADKLGVKLDGITGSGVDGRITVEDVQAAARTAKPATAAAEEMPALDVSEDEADISDAPYRLKTQARRVTESKRFIPHFYVSRGVDVTKLYARKDELKEKFGATLTHLVMFASVKALKEHPEVNRSYDRGRIIAWKGINLGLAVETDDGLTVVSVRGAQELSLKEIVKRTGELVEKARGGKLPAEDRKHPTFTVSSLGMFDVEQFSAIINPPSSMTLAVASALPAPIVKDDEVTVGRMMVLTLSCDHRIIDGVQAAKFLQTLKGLLEDDKALLRGQK